MTQRSRSTEANTARPPTADELDRAHRTLARLHRSIGPGEVRDLGGSDAWEGLVEGKRMLAVATAYLGSTDPKYRAAWERMVER